MDRATTHFNKDFSIIFEKYKSHYILIPPGLTRYLQPLDVAVNKSFKNSMKSSDCEFRLKNNNNTCPSDNIIITHVVNDWYDNEKIKKEIIIRSFKKTGISLKKNGEENDQIDNPTKFTDDLLIPNEINLFDIDKNDAYELFKCPKYNDAS